MEIVGMLFWALIIAGIIFLFNRKKVFPDSRYNGLAEKELNEGTVDEGIWAKALVTAKGDEELRKVEYVKLRARQLQKSNK